MLKRNNRGAIVERLVALRSEPADAAIHGSMTGRSFSYAQTWCRRHTVAPDRFLWYNYCMHVYVITNTINGKLYVGQHAGKYLDKYLDRNVRYALRNKGNKTYLYNAIRRYGPEAFSIRSIHSCADKAGMDAAEIAYIKFFGTQDPDLGYNITAGGGGRLGTVTGLHTEEWKQNMSSVMKGRKITWSQKISDAQKGRPLTEEHKAALRAAPRTKHKVPRSPEHCAQIRENKLKYWARRKAQEAMSG